MNDMGTREGKPPRWCAGEREYFPESEFGLDDQGLFVPKGEAGFKPASLEDY